MLKKPAQKPAERWVGKCLNLHGCEMSEGSIAVTQQNVDYISQRRVVSIERKIKLAILIEVSSDNPLGSLSEREVRCDERS
jgi:hypothetical protein